MSWPAHNELMLWLGRIFAIMAAQIVRQIVAQLVRGKMHFRELRCNEPVL